MKGNSQMNIFMQNDDSQYMKYDYSLKKNYTKMNILDDSQNVMYSNIFDQINSNFNRYNHEQTNLQSQISISKNNMRDQNLDDLIQNDKNLFKFENFSQMKSSNNEVKKNQSDDGQSGGMKEQNQFKIDWVQNQIYILSMEVNCLHFIVLLFMFRVIMIIVIMIAIILYYIVVIEWQLCYKYVLNN